MMVDAVDVGPAARVKAAQVLAISDRQVRRKVARFLALRSVDAFLPQPTGPVRGSAYLHPHTEKVVREEIQLALKSSPDIGVDDIYPLKGEDPDKATSVGRHGIIAGVNLAAWGAQNGAFRV